MRVFRALRKLSRVVALLGFVHMWLYLSQAEPRWMMYGPVPWLIFALIEGVAWVMWYVGDKFWSPIEVLLRRVNHRIEQSLRLLKNATGSDEGREWLDSMGLVVSDPSRLQMEFEDVRLLPEGSRQHLTRLAELANEISDALIDDHLFGRSLKIDAMTIESTLGLRPMSDPIGAMMVDMARADQYLRNQGIDPNDYYDAMRTGNREKLRTIVEWAQRHKT